MSSASLGDCPMERQLFQKRMVGIEKTMRKEVGSGNAAHCMTQVRQTIQKLKIGWDADFGSQVRSRPT